ncbi:hypothetical protein L2E82_26573 [Cichorium intybus]|uniref:Uncharacterized protein n=1 Tax=Cichorium intybus TaxID=13427 RepID=A0ACB9CQY0_CICIN|nr:hypothetical protein L2E82_26573 [Cichorium intybus]
MKTSLLNLSVFVFLLTLSFSVSWAALSSILEVRPGSQDIVSCIESKYSNNATSDSEFILTPANVSFVPVWEVRIQNTRFLKPSTPKPSVILTPVNETLIQTALYCAKKLGYEIRIRSGGHDYEALSYSADVPFVMLDLVNMRSIDIDAFAPQWVLAGTWAVVAMETC